MSDEKSRIALTKLINLHVDDLLQVDVEDIMAEALELGADLDDLRCRHLELVERAEISVGRKRMLGARARLDAHKSEALRGTTPSRRIGVTEARAVTLAARNGTEQSERDQQTVQDDLDELAAFGEDVPE